MKLTIEIIRVEGGEDKVLHRARVNVISPRWAKTRAQRLVNEWKARGANSVRIINQERQQVYSWRED